MSRIFQISMLAAALAGCGDETCLCVVLNADRSPPLVRPDTTSTTDEFEVSDAQEYFLSGLPVLDTLDLEGVASDGGVWAYGDWAYDRARNSVTLEEDAPIAVETIRASYDLATAAD